jgi:HK97 gp10 family phage protein
MMALTITPEQLSRKLDNLAKGTIPAVEKAMLKAALNVEGESRKYCTPGKSPYYRAPYSDDNDPRREPPHMRDTIKGEVKTEGSSVRGTIGTPKDYALAVHDGTSRMQARPFIMDAIKAKQNDTLKLLSQAVEENIRSQCV